MRNLWHSKRPHHITELGKKVTVTVERLKVKKYKILTVRYDNGTVYSVYRMNVADLGKWSCDRSLGVIIGRDLRHKQQCIKALNKSNTVLGPYLLCAYVSEYAT